MNNLAKTIRDAIARDGRSLYAIAKAASLRYGGVHRFVNLPGAQLRTDVASKLCDVLGLELRPLKRSRGPKGR